MCVRCLGGWLIVHVNGDQYRVAPSDAGAQGQARGTPIGEWAVVDAMQIRLRRRDPVDGSSADASVAQLNLPGESHRMREDDFGHWAAPRLLIYDADGRETTHAFPAEGRALVFGKSRSKVDVCVDDPFVSRVHARFSRCDGAPFVEDLGSTHGTQVNGQMLTGARELAHNDAIVIGGTRLRFTDYREYLRGALGDSQPSGPEDDASSRLPSDDGQFAEEAQDEEPPAAGQTRAEDLSGERKRDHVALGLALCWRTILFALLFAVGSLVFGLYVWQSVFSNPG